MLQRTPDPNHYPPVRIVLERYAGARSGFFLQLNVSWIIGGLFLLALFAVFVLPLLLPLGGSDIRAPSELADSNGAFAEVDGDRLYYTYQPGDKGPVVLLHGFGGSTVTWDATMKALGQHEYSAYAVDLPGFGLSEKGRSNDYRVTAQAERVVAWMDQQGIKQAFLIGHSRGGQVALAIALTYPQRVRGLALVSSALVDEDAPRLPRFVVDWPFTRRWAQIAVRRAAPRLIDDLLTDAAYNDAALTPELRAAYRRVMSTSGWELALLEMLAGPDAMPLPGALRDIPTPVLLVRGVHDSWISDDQSEVLGRLFPDAENVVLEDVGYLPMHEDPDAFHAAVLGFLERLTETPAAG